jgi:hypothetical protein
MHPLWARLGASSLRSAMPKKTSSDMIASDTTTHRHT